MYYLVLFWIQAIQIKWQQARKKYLSKVLYLYFSFFI